MIKKSMRNGISIIELIFTIVIIALVFTVIPKVVFALKKSDSFAVRQDAILNTVSLMQMISKMPWDEENILNSDILHVGSVNFDCNKTTYYRVGGFVGSRICPHDLNASVTVNFDDGEGYDDFDDVDDYNNQDLNTTLYNIHTTVSYFDDFSSGSSDSLLVDLNNSSINSVATTNLKRIDIKTIYNGNRGEAKELMSFSYTSTNIGQFFIHKRVWK